MSALIKMAAAAVFMAVLPVLEGLLPCALLPKEKRTLPRIVLTGYFMTFTTFELTALPVLLLTDRGNFDLLVVLFTVFSVIIAAAGIAVCARTGGIRLPECIRFGGKKNAGPGQPAAPGQPSEAGKPAAPGQPSETGKPPVGRTAVVLWAVFALILLFQLAMAYTHASFDGDDAFYVAASVITDSTSTMYRILPYTGGSTSLDVRHALAMLPMWFSYIARLSGMHAAIVTHSLAPCLFIPLADLAMGMTASKMIGRSAELKDRKEVLPVIMILLAVLQIFGNVSIYTPETFLMMRSWQGKSVYANLLLPAVFLSVLEIAELYEKDGTAAVSGTSAESEAVPVSGQQSEHAAADQRTGLYFWIFAMLVNCTAGLCTSMAAIYVPGMMGLASVFAAAALRKGRIVRNTVLICLPNAAYMILFAVLLMNWNIFMG